MATIYWPESPLVQLENHHPNGSKVKWLGRSSLAAKMGDRVKFRIRMVSKGNQETTWFKYRVETLDSSNNVTETIANIERVTGDRTDTITISMNSQVQRFRVTVWNFHYYQYSESAVSGNDNRRWYPPEIREFAAFIQYFGDYSLDYIPITILYDPPYQDCINSVSQSEVLATRVAIGTKESMGVAWQSKESISGGISIGIPGVFESGVGGTSSSGSGGSEEIGEGQTNTVTLRYQFNTKLVADNQNTIGRAYWGALSDIYVLLKNPWFQVVGNESGQLGIAVSSRSSIETKIIILPAHRLLRPDGDPIAEAIPQSSRRRLLELDPFITNLDQFFPIDTGVALKNAVNQQANPSIGNRAALIAKYSISNGVTLDLSQITDLEVSDSLTNQTGYTAEVSNSIGMSSSTKGRIFYVGAELNTSGTSSSSRFIKVGFQESEETSIGLIKSARCVLTRNQVAEDLNDVQIWWDKHFSTFMFREVPPILLFGIVRGILMDVQKVGLNNALISIEYGRKRKSTMTDHKGAFEFVGIPAGKATVRYGGVNKKITITKNDLKRGYKNIGEIRNAIREIDLRKSSVWELANVCGTDVRTAKELAKGIRNAKRLNREKLVKLLKKAKIAIKDFDKKAKIIRY